MLSNSNRRQRSVTSRETETHDISLEPFDNMLDLLKQAIRRQNIDHAQIIDGIHRLVVLVRAAEPAFILVEPQQLPVAEYRPLLLLVVRQLDAVEETWIRGAVDGTAHGNGFRRAGLGRR